MAGLDRGAQIVVIGASAAGLAVAKLLKDKGFSPKLFEAAPHVGARWRGHYDRLHLHTPKGQSALPGLGFPASAPRYPSRDQVVDYLETYAAHFDLRPRFDTPVTWVTPGRVQTVVGAFAADAVIFATGLNNVPRRVEKPGLDSFPGLIVHSADYRSGRDFRGQKVLVVGFGNSACEIAIDLHEQGAFPVQSVRGPVNALPRDIFGIPVLSIGKYARLLPPRLSDRLNAPLIRALIGDIGKLGLQKLPYGPIEQIRVHRKIPLLDIGTLALMRAGKIGVFPDIQRVEERTVYFVDGRADDFDAIILATGYERGLERIVTLTPERLRDLAEPVAARRLEGQDGYYFCGSFVSPRGMLHEIGIEAEFIADRLASTFS